MLRLLKLQAFRYQLTLQALAKAPVFQQEPRWELQADLRALPLEEAAQVLQEEVDLQWGLPVADPELVPQVEAHPLLWEEAAVAQVASLMALETCLCGQPMST